MHLHLRQDEILKTCAPESARWFARALVMPNTLPAVNSAERLIKYRDEITKAAPGFHPLMSFKLCPGMTGKEVDALADAGAVAGKLYPEGSTTNSQDGVKSWKEIDEALSAMQNRGIVLSIHGEKPDSFVLDREKDYLPELFAIIEHCPDLKIVFEHLSSKEGIRAVAEGPSNLAGTITAHHLYLTLDDLIGGGINPHNFCKPVVKTPEDREAVRNAALSGNSKFFFGSDSAPHPEQSKLSPKGSAGIYSAPAALPLLVSFFEKNSSLDRLENFTSVYGARFYSLPLNTCSISLDKRGYAIPASVSGIVPFMAGHRLEWNISSDEEKKPVQEG